MNHGHLNVEPTIELEELKRRYEVQRRLLADALVYVEDDQYLGCTVEDCQECRKTKDLARRINRELELSPAPSETNGARKR